jgi:hypothetical protein
MPADAKGAIIAGDRRLRFVGLPGRPIGSIELGLTSAPWSVAYVAFLVTMIVLQCPIGPSAEPFVRSVIRRK